MIKTIILYAVSAFFVVHSIITTLRNNYNFGVLLMWLVSSALLVYAIFHKKIDVLTSHGFGRFVRILVILGIFVYLALFLFVAVSGYTDSVKGDEKALIVLGAGVHGETVSNILHRRLTAALHAWEKNPDMLIVVSGGQGPQERIPEAEAMKKWLLQRGVPAEKIIVENKSTSTEENLQFSKPLLLEAGITPDMPIGVVTNAFHCYRAEKYAIMAGFTDVRTVPASISPTIVLPSYLREVLAVLYLWVFRR